MAPTHQLSRSAFERLQSEHHDLSTRGRIEIASTIERARELGDLSENGDYHAAKDAQGHMEARIRHIEWILDHAEIVEDATAGVVGAGSLVTLLYEGDDEDMAETYLVGHIEEQAEHPVISPTSPLGSVLMGRAAGDEVEYEAPTGLLKVQILAADVP